MNPLAHARTRLLRVVPALAVGTCLAFAAPSSASAAPALTVGTALYDCTGEIFGTNIIVPLSGSGFSPDTPLSVEIFYPDGNYSALGTFVTVGVDGTWSQSLSFSPWVEGTSRVRLFTDADKDLQLDPGGEAAEGTFEVSCPDPLPTSREECSAEGFEVFKNRGDCVAFVATQGKNEPGQNVPGAP